MDILVKTENFHLKSYENITYFQKFKAVSKNVLFRIVPYRHILVTEI